MREIVGKMSARLRWRDLSGNMVRVDLDHGVVLSWWPRTGTVLFQGPPDKAGWAKSKFVLAADESSLLFESPRLSSTKRPY
ncbi:hypothetical protein GGE24_007139 [Bradyrhizobium centrosematis]|nr:hypothetical protein [Bradyrhizobium centrosematis]MCS3777764.1 hypothetical protein [Bradyrhizobium centrosematis]